AYQPGFNDTLSNAAPGGPFAMASRGYLTGMLLASANGTGAWPAAGSVTESCSTPGHGLPCWEDSDIDTYGGTTNWWKGPNQSSTIYGQPFSYPPSYPQVIISRRVACSHIASRST